MLGKLVGKAVGQVVALPATIIAEGADALDEAAKTVDRQVAKATEPDDDRRP